MKRARDKGPATYREVAVAQLREAIVRGQLEPGLLLKEADLAAELGLSVTPVREALVELSSEGLVEIEPNRRKRVAPIDLQAMVELLEVQQRLWGLSYEWGAHRIGPAELKRLRAAYASHDKALRAGKLDGAIAAVFSFHRVLMDASGNRELARISMDRLALIQRFLLQCAPNVVYSGDLAHPNEMLQALERGDSKAALRLYNEIASFFLTAVKALRDQQHALDGAGRTS